MLEKRTYTIQELSNIIGTADKSATDRKLKNYEIAFTNTGRGRDLTYTITDIPDRFKVFCVFDLGFNPHTDFTKLRDFLFYLLGDDDFNWRPMEMMEEYLRIAGKGMSRHTISKYIEKIKGLNLVAGTDFVYYRVYKNFGVQAHEIITREEYSKAWSIYWDAKEQGYDSKAAYSCMYNAFHGVPRKQRKLEQNALCQDRHVVKICVSDFRQSQVWRCESGAVRRLNPLPPPSPPRPGRYARRWRRECRPGGGGS